MRAFYEQMAGPEGIPLVEKASVFDERGQAIEGYCAVREAVSKKVMAINSDDYTIVQNRDVAKAVLMITEDSCRDATRIGVIGNKRKMHISGLYKEEVEVVNGFGDTEMHPVRFEVINSYDTSTGLIVNSSLMRMQCMNILYGALPRELDALVGKAKLEQNYAIGKMHKGDLLGHHTDIMDFIRKRMDYQKEISKKSAKFFSMLKDIKVNDELKQKFIAELKMPEKYNKMINNEFSFEGKKTLWHLFQAATYVVSNTIENPERREMFGQKITRTMVAEYITETKTVEQVPLIG